MKKLLSLSVMALLALAVMPAVFAAGIGTGIDGGISVEDFPPIVWQCGDRFLTDEEVQPWRCSNDGQKLLERSNNYLFEGETYYIDVVVWDKNKIQDVVVDLILGEGQGDMDYNINCVPAPVCDGGNECSVGYVKFDKCNAMMLEEDVEFDDATMQGYTCAVTALDSEHMYGQYWLTVQADDGMEEPGMYDEMTPIWINPIIDMDIDGGLDFEDVRPGTSAYSQVVIENIAEGGVALDMFITGNDWPAADMDLGRCQNLDGSGNEIPGLVNYLPLGAFRYYAENGAYSTRLDYENDDGYSSVVRDSDIEGYVNINQQLNAGFEEAMFDDAEIIQAGGPVTDVAFCDDEGYRANVLNPGATMALTFRLDLPEPCYGEFESEEEGSIFIWAEAI